MTLTPTSNTNYLLLQHLCLYVGFSKIFQIESPETLCQEVTMMICLLLSLEMIGSSYSSSVMKKEKFGLGKGRKLFYFIFRLNIH